MPISVNWTSKEIYIPKNYLQIVQMTPIEIRQLDINAFRLELKQLEASEGIPFLTTHNHNTTITVGGVTLARVLEIINGYTITFEDGTYAVNLVGANSNIGDVINLNQVSVRSNNSAGLTYSEAINNQSYQNVVTIDISSGTSGVLFPKGTPTDPVNNFNDAVQIANQRKLKIFNLNGILIFTPFDDISDKCFMGSSPINAYTVLSGQLNNNTVFEKISLTGILNGRISAEKCALGNLQNVSGVFNLCGLNGNLKIDTTNTALTIFTNCFSARDLNESVEVDLDNIQCDVKFKYFNGNITLSNLNTNKVIVIDGNSANIEINNTCVTGTIVISGSIGTYIDNSGPGCTIIDLRQNAVLLNSDINDFQNTDSIGQNILISRLQAALAAALSA